MFQTCANRGLFANQMWANETYEPICTRPAGQKNKPRSGNDASGANVETRDGSIVRRQSNDWVCDFRSGKFDRQASISEIVAPAV